MGNEVSNPTQADTFPPLDRLPKENDASYARRSKVYSQIIRHAYPNLSDNKYQYWGRFVHGIDETSIPSPEWNRIQCVYWISYFLEYKIVLSAHYATPIACKFRGSGDYLIRMEKRDLKDLFWGSQIDYDHAWQSLWLRMENIKEKGLIRKEAVVEEGRENNKLENEKKQEKNSMWADELLDLSEKEDS